MSQLRLDPLTGRWVVVSTERAERPQAFEGRSLAVESEPRRPCPFCPGNEEATPPALETYGPGGGWSVRVVPNLYPAFHGRGAMSVEHLGPVFTQSPAPGIHEVLVLSPGHDTTWADLSDPQVGLVMAAIRDRMEEHSSITGVRYTQAIVNAGREAGASVEHPHGQLLGMPFVPGEIADEQAGFDRFAGACLLCTTLEAEEDAGHRVLLANSRVAVVCPYWSGTPYEMLVLPRECRAHLHQVAPPDLVAVGRAIRTALGALRVTAGDVAYNLVLHSAPFRATTGFHWHVHVLPKVTTRAGFELGTGVLINVLAPEYATAQLRAALATA